MSACFDVENLARVVGGRWIIEPAGAQRITGVGTDTRQNLSGRAFIALRGPRHDGHDHLRSAVQAGAGLLIIDRSILGGTPDGVAVLRVADTRAALRDLAGAHRAELSRTTVIAVTGSCGKTTTKEMIHAALAGTLIGTRAPRSFNNDIGVPLTILDASPDDEYVVLEIGMNRPGEIAALAQTARPDIAVITTIGPAHLGGLGSVRAIAAEKASLLDALVPDGWAMLNADHEFAAEHAARFRNVRTFGASTNADVRLTDYGYDEALELWWFDVNAAARFRLALPGRHNAVNALAAVAVAQHLGVADERISCGLAGVALPGMRMSRQQFGSVCIFNDAHNANPQSMPASIHAFLESTPRAARHVLILGDMLELGPDAASMHEALGQSLLETSEAHSIDRIIFIGELMRYAHHAVAQRWGGGRVQAFSELDRQSIAKIWGEFRSGDAVLLKASRGLALERILDDRPDTVDFARRAMVV